VVLADGEDVEPELIGQLDLLHQVAHPLLGTDAAVGRRIGLELGERVDADLHGAPSNAGRGSAMPYPGEGGKSS
jgi:hypothetical protein